MFRADPSRYTPEYGGYCAWGLGAKNELFPIDPTAWRIVNDRLYLNYNADIQSQWVADIPGFIERADAFWAERQARDAD